MGLMGVALTLIGPLLPVSSDGEPQGNAFNLGFADTDLSDAGAVVAVILWIGSAAAAILVLAGKRKLLLWVVGLEVTACIALAIILSLARYAPYVGFGVIAIGIVFQLGAALWHRLKPNASP